MCILCTHLNEIKVGVVDQRDVVSVHKIHKMIQEGTGPRFVKIGPLVRFRPEDLAAYIEANSRGGQTVSE